MTPTPYPDANAMIEVVLGALRAELGPKLVGLAVFGSLVTGAYEPGISDIDLVAALTDELTPAEGVGLTRMHAAIAAAHPAWAELIEVGYLSVATLAAFTATSPMDRISPGEPFHLTETGNPWRINLLLLRERGVAVWGPEPVDLVGPIGLADVIAAQRELMAEWRAWIEETEHIYELGYQGYMVLTMCRALSLARTGAPAAKLEAAAWAERELPEWATLIQQAIIWRRETALGQPPSGDPAVMLPEVLRFVHGVIDEVVGER